MEFSIRHRLPGRIRLHIPALAAASSVAAGHIVTWLKAQDGITEARINQACASLVVTYDEAQRETLDSMLGYLRFLSPRDLLTLVAQTEPAPEAPVLHAPAEPPATLGPSVLALPSVSLALAFSASPLALAANIPLMIWNAWPIAKRAWGIWSREKRLNVDFLDTLAITASIGQGLMVTGGIITWLIRLGDWIRDLTARGSKRAIAGLMEFQTRTAWLLVDGAVVSVPATRVVAGDLVVVYPGEMVPVDGEIVDGDATIDQKTITGEGLPVSRGKGEAVFAATALREGQITIRAERVGADTIAGQIAQLVDNAPIGDTRMQNHAERFADRLVVPTLGLAIGSAAVTADFQRFLSLVIIDIGTGIRVAAPTSVLASMTHAARNGIIIKSGGHMERLAQVDTVVFDKTGTLTHGTPEVIDVITYQNSLSADRLLGLAVGAESRLTHPVAEALRASARDRGISVPLCDAPDYKVGLGVQGQVNGHYVHIGSERFLRGSQIRVKQAEGDRASLDEHGYSCLYMAVDGKLAGLIPYADKIRPESRDVIRALHAMGIKETVMLTGDNATVASAVGGRIGLTRQFADMMPTGKAEVIAELQREGRVVAMVGDGINDSVALTYSDVGIAMRHGPEVTHESAHVVLMEDSLWKLVQAIEVSRGAIGLIRQNYGIVAVLNALALGLALPTGLVSPSFTAVLSNGSAILASLNGIRPLMRAR
ncbi:heavy metal translocating P-type ATPase [Acidisphaera sp. S103]|uniref:heavy metal translocating P-type ATPase n=1 Tax=Acidisphaera sp. S103 TaxID=1747223 RepID=UPI00131B188F|nr:heavy metal translocating P-type ATPase [Acidisphaera sp. S103]